MTEDNDMYYNDTCIELQLNMFDNPEAVLGKDDNHKSGRLTGLLDTKCWIMKNLCMIIIYTH